MSRRGGCVILPDEELSITKTASLENGDVYRYVHRWKRKSAVAKGSPARIPSLHNLRSNYSAQGICARLSKSLLQTADFADALDTAAVPTRKSNS